ncbi:MAG: hypothetical protein ACREOO_00440 [bacterium]
MKELFYFAPTDLLARVEYQQADNSLRYAAHRKMTVHERFMIEQYLLATFALKTEYYQRQPALLMFQGTDSRLRKALDKFHSENTLPKAGAKEKDVDDSISDLIGRSMQNYYFEQIGDMILNARREQSSIKHDFAAELREQHKRELEELVRAYNLYADQEISLDEIVPFELKPYFGIPAGIEHFCAENTVR